MGFLSKIPTLYGVGEIEKLIDSAIEKGYELIRLRDGVLGCGDLVLLAPDGWWNVVVREVYINCWSSGHTVRRCRKISKRLQAEIDAALLADAEQAD